MDYKELSWLLLISYGAAVKDHDYLGDKEYIDFYGNCINADEAQTRKALKAMKEHGIALDKMSDPQDDYGFGFVDTFTEEPNRINYMYGKIITGDGQEFWWASKIGFNTGFSDLINLLAISQDLTFEAAINKLEDRLANGYLPFTSEIGYGK